MHLPRFPWRPRWFIDDTLIHREGSRSQGRKLTYQALELGSNNFSVTLVASLGFFTSSYVLTASSNILPMLGFVYWSDETKPVHETAFNNVTVAGTMVGMLASGFLADKLGRRKMYGFETIVLMVGTLGVVMSSAGFIPLGQVTTLDLASIDYSSFGSMNIYSWLLFWRFVTGVGIGGEYPINAVIASEFSPTSKRPRILATVFAMRGIGTAAGAIVSLVVTSVVQAHSQYDPASPEASARAVDQIWRWVIGIALIPALLTAILRFTIPESARFTLDVRDDPLKASYETDKLKRLTSRSNVAIPSSPAVLSQYSMSSDEKNADIRELSVSNNQNLGSDFRNSSVKQYFWIEGNWRYLLATSLGWFLVDLGTFALGLNESSTLSMLWNGPTIAVKNPKTWDSNMVDPNASIFSVIIANSVHTLLLESIAYITGSVLLALFISRLNRKLLTWVMFLVTGTLFIVLGVSLLETPGTQGWGINMALYALCKFSEAFGVSPLSFLLPAELFPTKFRASCYGISAASGKLGALLASIFLGYVTFGEGKSKITPHSAPSAWLSYVFIVFAAPLFLGAGVTWLFLPELQDKSGKNKTLEQLAEGRRSARPDAFADPEAA